MPGRQSGAPRPAMNSLRDRPEVVTGNLPWYQSGMALPAWLTVRPIKAANSVAFGGVHARGLLAGGGVDAFGLVAIGGVNAFGIVAIGGVNAIGLVAVGGVHAMGLLAVGGVRARGAITRTRRSQREQHPAP